MSTSASLSADMHLFCVLRQVEVLKLYLESRGKHNRRLLDSSGSSYSLMV
jgi:hypothetical protein